MKLNLNCLLESNNKITDLLLIKKVSELTQDDFENDVWVAVVDEQLVKKLQEKHAS